MRVLSKICSVLLCLCFLLQMNAVINIKAYESDIMPCYNYVQSANAHIHNWGEGTSCSVCGAMAE